MNADSSRERELPRLRDRMRKATEDALLEAAEEVLAQHGMQTARIETIAARAGVAVGTVYNYFADRDALLAALIQLRRMELIEVTDAALAARKGQPWRAVFRGFLEAFLAHVDRHRAFFTILFMGELLPVLPRDCDEPNQPRAVMLEMYQRVEKLMRAGVRAHVLRSDDVAAYPSLCMGMLRAMILREQKLASPRPFTELADVVARMFLQGAEDRSR